MIKSCLKKYTYIYTYQILNSILEQENLLSNQVINPYRDNIFTNMNELCYVVSIHLFLIIVCKTLKEIRNIKRYIYIYIHNKITNFDQTNVHEKILYRIMQLKLHAFVR